IASAEAWSAAFDFSEVSNATITAQGLDSHGSSAYEEYDSDMYHFYSDSQERFCEYKADEIFSPEYPDSGTMYVYEFDSKWKKTREMLSYRQTADKSICNFVDAMTSVYDEESDTERGYMHERYSEFSYDESKYAYVAHFSDMSDMNWSDGYSDLNVTVKFKNGKLSECEMSVKDNVESKVFNMKVTVSKIGSTAITLPNVENDGDDTDDRLDGVYTIYLCTYDSDKKIDGLYTFAADREVQTEIEIKDGKIGAGEMAFEYKLEDDGFSYESPYVTAHFVKVADGEYHCYEIGNYICKQDKTPSYPILGEVSIAFRQKACETR
ncbi:MAG: hypothetical protein K2L54_05790, partial [Clostridiales bacterium]|nr:hypothetical protein [Clostridiales bacterium]